MTGNANRASRACSESFVVKRDAIAYQLLVRSSCWVALVEGEVHEVQYTMPVMDKQFIEKEMKNPTGAVGRCVLPGAPSVCCGGML